MRGSFDVDSFVDAVELVDETRDPFFEWVAEMHSAKKLKWLISAADPVTRARYRRFLNEPGIGTRLAALRALEWRAEDRQAAKLQGPLVLVDGKVRYRPFPGERTFPGDLIEVPEAAEAA